MLRRSLVLITVAGLVAASDLAAQEEDAGPEVVVVTQFKCDLDTTELNAFVNAHWAPAVDDAVAEGRLQDWGVLEHFWGDEWNFVVWYAAEDIQSFHAAWEGIGQQVFDETPDFSERLNEFCSEHRDNIYRVTRSAGASR